MQGPLKAPSKAISLRIFGDFSGPYGLIRGRMGRTGPARALEEREKFWKNVFFIFKYRLPKIVVFNIHMPFFDGSNVFFRFLVEMRFRTILKLPQKASSRTKTCSFGTSCTLP